MKRAVEIIINIIFWLIIVILISGFYYSLDSFGAKFVGNKYPFHLVRYVLFLLRVLPALLFNYYFFYLYLVPLLQKKKVVLIILLAIIGSIVSALIMILCFIIIKSEGLTFYVKESLFVLSLITLIIGVIGGAIKGFALWRTSIAERNALERIQSESKTALLLLKAQINPHFLFNSLNNIDILIEETPKIASEYLKKLSDILRYVLYETKEDETELVKELEQIKSYIELQKIRTDNPQFVSFRVSGELEIQRIAPMIFLPFIENAFKHCKNKTIDNAIDIEFEIHNNMVKMVCKNYFEPNQIEILKGEGLGIETIKQRLNLLYPAKHDLDIENTEHWFNVTLNIYL